MSKDQPEMIKLKNNTTKLVSECEAHINDLADYSMGVNDSFMNTYLERQRERLKNPQQLETLKKDLMLMRDKLTQESSIVLEAIKNLESKKGLFSIGIENKIKNIKLTMMALPLEERFQVLTSSAGLAVKKALAAHRISFWNTVVDEKTDSIIEENAAQSYIDSKRKLSQKKSYKENNLGQPRVDSTITVSLIEPVKTSYIYVNKADNQVYLLMPVFSKQDKDRQKKFPLWNFFSAHADSALNELITYQNALEIDISLLVLHPYTKAQKQARLDQIIQYRIALDAVAKKMDFHNLRGPMPTYPRPLELLMKLPESNAHSMHLEPNKPFITRLSEKNVVFGFQSGRDRVFQNALAEIHKDMIKNLQIPQANISLFQSVTNETPASLFQGIRNTEKLSIITQFFLGIVNIYCYSKGLSAVNFGVVLEQSKELSKAVADTISLGLQNSSSIEEKLCDLVSANKEFGLTTVLSKTQKAEIIKKFTDHYLEIDDSKYFDEFIVIDTDKPGLFIPYQGSICLNFAEFMRVTLPDFMTRYFEVICAGFKSVAETLKRNIPFENLWVNQEVTLSVKALLEPIQDKDQLNALLKKLPAAQQDALMNSHEMKIFQVEKIQAQEFWYCVARGKQKEAENLLKTKPEAELLMKTASFTDYSGRAFHCTAFEYAYWARDLGMCQMLIQYMDEDLKEEMLKRCDVIEWDGLAYTKNGKETKSKHFSLIPLINMLNKYYTEFEQWSQNLRWDSLKAIWMMVGIRQRELPAYLAHEYCSPRKWSDRANQCSTEQGTPNLVFESTSCLDANTIVGAVWYPLEDGKGLGFDFAAWKGESKAAGTTVIPGRFVGRAKCELDVVRSDLVAITNLDKELTTNIAKLREALQPSKQGLVP